MTDQDERFVVTVSDHAPTAPARPSASGPAAPAAASDGAGYDGAGQDSAGQDSAGHDGVGHEGAGYDGESAIPAGFGLAVISGLADDVRVLSTSSGVSVRMSWPSTAVTS